MDRTAARIANSAAIVLNLDCRLTARARGISVMLAFSGIVGTRISADISQNDAATKAAKAPKTLIHCKDVILPSGSVIGARWRGTHGRRSYYHSPALSHARARADLEPPPMWAGFSFGLNVKRKPRACRGFPKLTIGGNV